MNLLEGVTLRDILDPLKRYWYVAILSALVAAISAYAVSSAQPAVYRATVTLLARPNRADYSLDLFLKARLNSFKAVLTSRTLAEEVIRRTRVDMAPADVASHIRVVANPEDSTLVVTVDSALPQQAQAIADALADVFVEKVQAENLELPPSDLKVDIQKLDAPLLPERPISPNAFTNSLAGLLLGLTLGGVGLATWGMLDRTLKDVEDVERCLEVKVLASIPPANKYRWATGRAGTASTAKVAKGG